jgi:hypothetical protein
LRRHKAAAQKKYCDDYFFHFFDGLKKRAGGKNSSFVSFTRKLLTNSDLLKNDERRLLKLSLD